MRKIRILGTGVPTMDIYPAHKEMFPGGNEYNIACNVALLGEEAGFLGVFARDLAAGYLQDTLKNLGVDMCACRREKGSSGYSLVELKEDGDRIFLMWNQEGAADKNPIQFTEEELQYIATFDVLCAGRCANVSREKIEILSHRGIKVCYDFYEVFTEKEIKEMAPYIHYGFFSCSHLDDEKTKSVLHSAVEAGCKIAIGTRGTQSAFAYDGKNYYEQDVKAVVAKDALGAGDSFIAAFLVSYLKNQDVQRALKMATEYAAEIVMKSGSIGVGFHFDPPKLEELVDLS